MNIRLFILAKSSVFLLMILMLGSVHSLNAQTIQTPFGKNRVQYHDDFNNWWMYETDHFVTFWYGKGRNIAKSVMQMAELDHDEIQELMAHTMNDKIRIVIYLDHSDYTQTNIAYFDSKEAGGAGSAQFYDNKVIVFFNGDHQDLRKQIRAGITQAYLMSMFSGISIQEIYHNLVSRDLPVWFVSGLVAFIRDRWPSEVEEEFSYLFKNNKRKIRTFNRLAKEEPTLAGRSMWNFLSEKYGNRSISDLLYMIRIHKNINKSFKYVYGGHSRDIYREWKEFYEEHYTKNQELLAPADIKKYRLKKSLYPITRLCLDEQAANLYYTENNFGRIKLIKRSLENGREKTLLKYGYKNEHQLTDRHYPLFLYDENSEKLAIIYEKKDKIYFRLQDPENNSFMEHLFPENIQRIYSFDILEPGTLVLSASTDGFTDLFYYDLEKRQHEPITENYFDESSIKIARLEDKKGLFVISNNDSDSFKAMEYDSFPPLAKKDLFFLDLETLEAKRITNTPEIEEYNFHLSNGSFLLKGDRSYYKRTELWEEKGEQYDLTGLTHFTERNILSQDYKKDYVVWVQKRNENEWGLYGSSTQKDLFRPVRERDLAKGSAPFPREKTAGDSLDQQADQYQDLEIDESLLFQTRFPDPEKEEVELLAEMLDEQEKVPANADDHNLPIFNRSRAVASRLRFSFNELITRIDNEVLFEGLETYSDLNGTYSPPPTGFLVKTSVRDLFEDHVLEGGFRLASNLRGMEYFITYDDQKKKLDWRYSLYRKTRSSLEQILNPNTQPDKLKFRTNLAMVRAKYPFDIYRSLHATFTFRLDNTILTASNLESLEYPNINEQRAMIGVEYIFDNTSSKGVNLLSGTRYKIFSRFVNRFDVQLSEPRSYNFSAGRMGIIGFDARHYIDVLRYSTLALRIAGQSSFGNEKNIYFLGGVENAFFGKMDQSYPIPVDEDFAYMIQAANLRGYDYNIRNGSSFTLMNAELRIPVFTYLFPGYIKYAIFRDMQLTAFMDAGAAWYGWSPFSEENEGNVYYHRAPPAIVLKIRQFKDPLVAGMGFGLRTSLFGYFIKLDYAWGLDTGRFLAPKLYLSMAHDF